VYYSGYRISAEVNRTSRKHAVLVSTSQQSQYVKQQTRVSDEVTS